MERIPSKKELDVFYKKQFLYSNGQTSELMIRKRSKHILNEIRQMYPHAKTVCDVGSGYGFFLDEAKKQGLKAFGIEPSKHLAHSASIEFGFPQFVGTLEAYVARQEKRFDVVTCIHVVEHVAKPKEFIDTLLKLVKPHGVLFLETPNADSHLAYVEKETYTFFIVPEHLRIFSRFSIKALLPKPFVVSRVSTYSYPEHFMGIIKKLIFFDRKAGIMPNNQIEKSVVSQKVSFKKRLSYLLFDKILAPLLTPLLNLYHKGSILELYISKK